jgi:hypothetical protein
MAREVMRKEDGRLSPKEGDFVDDMVRWCVPGESRRRNRPSGCTHFTAELDDTDD